MVPPMKTHKLPSPKVVRNKIEDIEDEKYRLGFMYLYLICGRISEACGKYAPRGIDAFEVEFEVDGEEVPAVLFAVKTAKQKTKRGWILRPAALPLDPMYEPWAEHLLKYFQKAGKSHPFMYGPTPGSSQRYAQRVAVQAFAELEYNLRPYTRTKYEMAEEEIVDTRIKDGIKQYLIEFDDGRRKWSSRKDVIPVPIPVPGRWKPFTPHSLRRRRSRELELYYKFNGLDLKAIGGWEEKGGESHITDAMKAYLYLEITEAEENLEILKQIAEKYFWKLLRPLP